MRTDRTAFLGIGALASLGLALVPPLVPGAAGPKERGEPSRSAPATQARAEDEIGARCADCHAEIAASYRRTGMARALGPIAPGETAELGSARDGAGWRYHFESGEGSEWIVETRAEPPGDLASPRPHRRTARLVFAIGAGLLDRSYAAEIGGRLSFAPLEALGPNSTGLRRAALAPAHAMHPGARFDQAITPECLACHTDRLPPRDFPLDRLPGREIWSPRGIGCGACHARSEEHAAWREEELLGKASGADPLVAHRSMDTVARLSVCAACHLQGDARIELEGTRLAPPAPGGDLLAERAVFVAREPSQDLGFVSQTERLVLSRCFDLAAARPLLCETCHDPHRALAEPGERERVRAGCLSCHGGAGRTPGIPAAPDCSLPPERRPGDCASCHMRRSPVFDVAEVEIHDHWIRREPGSPSAAPGQGGLRAAESRGGDVAPFAWPGAPPREPEAGLELLALSRVGEVGRAAALVDRPPGPRAGRLPMYHHVRAGLLEGLGRLEDARLAYKRALVLDPELGESAVNLGLLLGRMGRNAEGIEVLDRLLARHPTAEGALRNRAVLRSAAGDRAGAERDLRAAFELLPRAAVASALADLARQDGRADEAELWHLRAAAIDPVGAAERP